MADLLNFGRGKQPNNIRCGSNDELKEVHSAGVSWAGGEAVASVAWGMVGKWSSTGGLPRPADINLKLGEGQRIKDVDLGFNRMSARLDDRYSKSCSCAHWVAFGTARLLLESALSAERSFSKTKGSVFQAQ